MNTVQTPSAATGLPPLAFWQAAAAGRPDLFDPLDAGARLALVPRTSPDCMLVWQVDEDGTAARVEPFAAFSSSGADIALSADAEALASIGAASADSLFSVLRSAIRSGHIVCYILRRRCHLEERGFDEVLTELGFAFMGACR